MIRRQPNHRPQHHDPRAPWPERLRLPSLAVTRSPPFGNGCQPSAGLNPLPNRFRRPVSCLLGERSPSVEDLSGSSLPHRYGTTASALAASCPVISSCHHSNRAEILVVTKLPSPRIQGFSLAQCPQRLSYVLAPLDRCRSLPSSARTGSTLHLQGAFRRLRSRLPKQLRLLGSLPGTPMPPPHSPRDTDADITASLDGPRLWHG